MSIDYFVLCREPPPARRGGWRLKLGPVAVRDLERPGPALARVAGAQPRAVFDFNCESEAADVSLEMARELARATRGAVVHEDGYALVCDFADQPGEHRSAAELEASWQRLLEMHAEAEQRRTEKERAAWAEVRAKDPRTDDENDWSKL